MAALIPQTEPAEDDGKMGTEIERKFTVVGDTWRPSARSVQIVQGYMTRDPRRVVRIRTMDNRGSITLKGISRGAARTEFEYEIPAADAHQMLNELCFKPLIDKTRYYVPHEGMVWEIDEFRAPRSGLILAELEIPSVDFSFERPDWVGEEVTGNPLFYNQNMT
jgi:adenylate cyclase